jgi:carboxylate-amine ligase
LSRDEENFATSMIDSIKDLHWDIRPSPHFGTVEVRVMDTPLTLGHEAVQQKIPLLMLIRPRGQQPVGRRLDQPGDVNRACRYGLEGVLTDVHTGEHKTVAEDIAWLLEQVAPVCTSVRTPSSP